MIAEQSVEILAAPRPTTVNQRIFRAGASVVAAGVVVKIGATCKEVVVAAAYGRSDVLDAFLVAFLIPNLLINLIAESMNQALIPTLIRVRLQQGHARAQELLSHSMLSMLGMLAAATAGMGLLARAFFPLIASNFAPSKLDLAIRLFYLLLPCVVMGGIASNCTAVLNTLNRFALPALAPLVIPLSIVAATLLLQRTMGIWALAAGTLAGTALHAGIVGTWMDSQGYAFRLRWYGRNEDTREVAHQFGPVLLSSVVASGGLLVDQAMAAMLPAGSVSALVFGGRFVGVVLTLLAGAISSTLAPHFSTLVAEKDWTGCRATLRTWTLRTALISTPIAVALIGGSHILVRITLQHGAFASRDTAVVATVLAMYAIQIPFFTASRVFYRFVVAMRRTDLVLYCGVINLVLDIVLNLVLMRWMGVAGIALATSLWSIGTFLFLGFWTNKLLSAATAERSS
ncbi:MAG TPA: lipid II flippase MurJ [Terracidiphilus sp.]|jgi:putative peptidoglycan lipid II flippase|nr:lipid II flippase MurJ [Terracidiphilus sp.]